MAWFLAKVSFILPLVLLSFPDTSYSLLITRQAGPPSVTLHNGSYHGTQNPTYGQDFFLGMPFAQPPVGDLRFRNPVSLNTTWTGTKNATQYGHACYGYGSDDWVLGNPVSEDCLTINVVRPTGTKPNAQLPVGVWIYGGGAYMGSSLDPRYNLSFIVEQSVQMGKPFIGVSLNYRLQAFGFLFGSAILKEGVTNIGYRDQRLALHWIQENIAAFGGDPAKVTIWGESAGAGSVGAQLLAYGGRDDKLFRGAIQESGGHINSVRQTNASTWDKYYNNITRATNCSRASDTLACLRKVPIGALNTVLNSSVTASVPYWGMVVDNDFTIATGTRQLLDGKFVKVPLLHGRNSDEGTSFSPKGINTTEQFLASVMSAGPDNATAATIAALYPDIPAIGIPATLSGRPPPNNASLGVQWKRSAAYVGDLRQHASRRLISQVYAVNNVSSWSYRFNVLVNGQAPASGAAHFQEVAFVFHNLEGLGYNNSVAVDPFENKPQSYQRLATIMSRMWIGFIADGDPNTNKATSIHWPVYTLDNPQNIVFDANVANLLHAEPDYYRAEGIRFISDRFISVYGR
ncbi:triacylglycerol lipase [Cladophialophora yegresii CBS 114405]|uniref:Carboxylic ester hydrolase n=1 Tax=Cladophialophora yegresii CBS 114405 TaxID=1182544 RepID=W9VVY3_9EURO|nr:triacylglycerol lipase [Cladophialophora yegresii CBS 114405]EXJ59992.1 triacylglycerol lipase [Cladophialophora yegresii CBS 114405]